LIRAVAFDLGGVLIQIHHEWQGAVAASGANSKASGPLGGFVDFDLYQRGDVSDEQFLASLDRFLETSDVALARAVHMAVLRDAYPGVDNLVAELTEQGVACGCLSNTNALHWATFFDGGRYAFGPSLRVRIGSHLAKANKPDEAIYRAFERESGFAGAEVAYFDDNPPNVEAARTLGWQAWLVDPTGDTAAQMRAHLGL
jgi:putative hydrolase of the HAD superfamily